MCACRFTYSSVQYTAFHAKKFTALVSTPTNGTSHPEHVDFELQSRALAQALYRTITEFHTFFKREAVGRVVKTAGFCKSLLGNFKGQNPDRFYFDVTRTHREVVDHVWSILHPSTRILQNDDSRSFNDSSSSPTGLVLPGRRGSNRPGPPSSSIRNSRHHSHSHHHHHERGGSSGSIQSSPSSPVVSPSSPTSRSSFSSTRAEDGSEGGSHTHPRHPPLPLPPTHARASGSGSMHRSHSIQDSDFRPPNFNLPPLPPYSQRSCSSDTLLRTSINGSRRQHLRTIPTHGPHMASMASFNPYLSPSISETGSDGEEEDVYIGGGSDYVTMSSCADTAIYLPSTQSDPGTSATLERRMYRSNLLASSSIAPSSNASDISGPLSDLYIMQSDSECSGSSYRVSSPPPLYREVDEEHTVPISFDTTDSTTTDGSVMPPSPGPTSSPNSASVRLVSPIIPMSGSESNFDAAAVLTRTRELEGELQRLRTAMTCRLCKQNPIGATFCPCGHTVCCFQCAQRMGTCWECDVTITSVQRMVLTR